MSDTCNLQIRVDSTLRNEAQTVLAGMGMDVSTAVRIFLRQVVTDRSLPFRPSLDPFYNPANVAHLRKVLDDVRDGRGIEEHALIGEER
ncbi:type II toxin-antitoxin system RelB/DinJ family antitoxin [Succinatimonas hippei]|uniref:type II toxin-antitoxin system RelB/DinJ family antitoxin n=1 Tax=Succinatimonas hippei TaxID=626938 RepID=UPI0026EB7B29|nr:type II toxin-antitoxin system RelB/DinJ family antitoxin [Succinatimonas hippei]